MSWTARNESAGSLIAPGYVAGKCVKGNYWAIQVQNNQQVSTEKPKKPNEGAAKGAADSPRSDFAAAVAAIMSLPLTNMEKAKAVRRLLAAE
jgi:hypothetical protein